MANKSENAEIAVLQDQVATVKQDVAEIKTDVKGLVSSVSALSGVYVTRSEFMQYKKDQKSSNLIKLITTALVTGIIAALVYLAFGVRS